MFEEDIEWLYKIYNKKNMYIYKKKICTIKKKIKKK